MFDLLWSVCYLCCHVYLLWISSCFLFYFPSLVEQDMTCISFWYHHLFSCFFFSFFLFSIGEIPHETMIYADMCITSSFVSIVSNFSRVCPGFWGDLVDLTGNHSPSDILISQLLLGFLAYDMSTTDSNLLSWLAPPKGSPGERHLRISVPLFPTHPLHQDNNPRVFLFSTMNSQSLYVQLIRENPKLVQVHQRKFGGSDSDSESGSCIYSFTLVHLGHIWIHDKSCTSQLANHAAGPNFHQLLCSRPPKSRCLS